MLDEYSTLYIHQQGVSDGFCPFAEWSLNGGSLDKINVAITEREANHTDPLDV